MSIKLATLAALFALAVVPAFAQTTTQSNVHYSGTSSQYTTPSIQGSYFAGANPCLVGVGAGGAGGPVGLSFTFGKNDEGCTRRSDAAAWHALGRDDVAIARMCQDSDNRKAFEAVGYVCPQDQRKTVAVEAPATALAAVAAPVPQAPAFQRPQWCETLSAAEKVSYRKTCG